MGELCSEIQELIPWVLNGSASDEESQLAHRHVMVCDDCRKELVQATIVARRIEVEMKRLPGLTLDEMTKLSSTIPETRDDEPLMSKLAKLLDALGMPEIVGDAIRGGAVFTGDSPTMRLQLPMVAPVDLRL